VNEANSVPVGAAEGCEKVGTTLSGIKSATGSRSIAAFGSSYREDPSAAQILKRTNLLPIPEVIHSQPSFKRLPQRWPFFVGVRNQRFPCKKHPKSRLSPVLNISTW
jgi:hypothetical protein